MRRDYFLATILDIWVWNLANIASEPPIQDAYRDFTSSRSASILRFCDTPAIDDCHRVITKNERKMKDAATNTNSIFKRITDTWASDNTAKGEFGQLPSM